MDKAPGVLLSSKWPSMTSMEKIGLMKNVVSLEQSLLSHHCSILGAFIMNPIILISAVRVNSSKLLTVVLLLGPRRNGCFSMMVGKNSTQIRGHVCILFPFCPMKNTTVVLTSSLRKTGNTAYEYILALCKRERMCIKQSAKFARPEGIFGGPGGYKPTREAKLAVLDVFEKSGFVPPS